MGGLSWVPGIGLLRNLDKCYEQSTRYDPEKVRSIVHCDHPNTNSLCTDV